MLVFRFLFMPPILFPDADSPPANIILHHEYLPTARYSALFFGYCSIKDASFDAGGFAIHLLARFQHRAPRHHDATTCSDAV